MDMSKFKEVKEEDCERKSYKVSGVPSVRVTEKNIFFNSVCIRAMFHDGKERFLKFFYDEKNKELLVVPCKKDEKLATITYSNQKTKRGIPASARVMLTGLLRGLKISDLVVPKKVGDLFYFPVRFESEGGVIEFKNRI